MPVIRELPTGIESIVLVVGFTVKIIPDFWEYRKSLSGIFAMRFIGMSVNPFMPVSDRLFLSRYSRPLSVPRYSFPLTGSIQFIV